MQKKPVSTWAHAGALGALLSIFLGLVYGWWTSCGYFLKWEWGGRPPSAMDVARNGDTSNFNNILKY